MFRKGLGAEPENRNWLLLWKPKSTMKLYHPQACFWGYIHSLWSFTFRGYFNHPNVPVRNYLFLCTFLLHSRAVLRMGFGNRRAKEVAPFLPAAAALTAFVTVHQRQWFSLSRVFILIFHISEHVLQYHYSEYLNYMHFPIDFLL